MPLPGFIAKLVGDKAVETVDTIANIADKFIQTKEEKDAFALELLKAKSDIELKAATLEKDIDEIYLKDTQDARNANARIQESEHASWLSKNVGYILDIFLATLWGTITIIMFLKLFKIAAQEVDMISLMALHGTVTAVFMMSVSFHRGTSRGSEDKSKELKAIREGK
jgi:hypothetical protein